MAHPNEVPDDQKDPDHLVPDLQKWEQIRSNAEQYAAEEEDDGLEVPDHEPADDDFDFEETPDEVTREETLQW